jgi:hypothetical protein
MATTTNFGWTTPNDTDLVKDGAAAIRTLGNGIDTSFLDLKGGTTDQVLAKNSGTDLDFKWVAQDDSNAIQNAIVDAKGDLISATGNDTPARLAVGANDTVLTADSTTATGLKWATPSSGGFTLISTTTPTVSTSVVTLSSIPGTYKHLLLSMQGIDSNGTSSNNIAVTFNGNTSTVYDSNTGVNLSSFDGFRVIGTSGGGQGGNMPLYNYASANFKAYFSQSVSYNAAGDTGGTLSNLGLFRSTSAISSITLTLGGGATYLASGSIFLYGMS